MNTLEARRTRDCEIFSVLRRNVLLWKWRSAGADRGMTVCEEEYPFFLQCVAAARARGYQPRSDWTGPCTLIGKHERTAIEGPPK